ncbi:hypothetical protein FEP71_04891 [Burkholderia multivorans]|nr:hypothetical protein [Burkholderia multivorans]MDR8901773.1 hypothetical protein [Burkholderia multivorans]MDR8913730.1 hypothetical protein [Burkholderia multivorans]MDR8962049.1 hypothetical protein [Burkholderia multivorans]MDR8981136.1 hypothetical protein [Burkholderia multivorans]
MHVAPLPPAGQREIEERIDGQQVDERDAREQRDGRERRAPRRRHAQRDERRREAEFDAEPRAGRRPDDDEPRRRLHERRGRLQHERRAEEGGQQPDPRRLRPHRERCDGECGEQHQPADRGLPRGIGQPAVDALRPFADMPRGGQPREQRVLHRCIRTRPQRGRPVADTEQERRRKQDRERPHRGEQQRRRAVGLEPRGAQPPQRAAVEQRARGRRDERRAEQRAERIGAEIEIRRDTRRQIGLQRFHRARQQHAEHARDQRRGDAAMPWMQREHRECAERHVAEHVGDHVEGGHIALHRREQIVERTDAERHPAFERIQRRVDDERRIRGKRLPRERRRAMRAGRVHRRRASHVMACPRRPARRPMRRSATRVRRSRRRAHARRPPHRACSTARAPRTCAGRAPCRPASASRAR